MWGRLKWIRFVVSVSLHYHVRSINPIPIEGFSSNLSSWRFSKKTTGNRGYKFSFSLYISYIIKVHVSKLQLWCCIFSFTRTSLRSSVLSISRGSVVRHTWRPNPTCPSSTATRIFMARNAGRLEYWQREWTQVLSSPLYTTLIMLSMFWILWFE